MSSPPLAPPAPAGLAGAVSEPAVLAPDPKTDPAAGRVHFPCLDGYRALAALMVFGFHLTFLTGFFGRHHTLGDFTARLDAGVPLFFVLSGFLLYRPFVAARLAGRKQPRTRDYLRRRALRIIPAYWLALTLIAFVVRDVSIHSAGQAVLYYGFAQIYAGGKYLGGGITQAWSLDTELSFYLFLPLWALALRWRHRLDGLDPGRRAGRIVMGELAGCAGLYVGAIAFRALAVGLRYHGSTAIVGTLYWLPATLDLFSLGMAMAVVSAWASQHPAAATRPALRALGDHPAAWWSAAALAYWAVSTRLGLPLDFVPLTTGQWVGREVLYGAFAFCLLVPGIFGSPGDGSIRRVLQLRPLAALGVVSYAVYLWHTTAIDVVRKGLHYPLFGGNFPVMLAASLLLTIAVAVASWYALERPVLRLKARR